MNKTFLFIIVVSIFILSISLSDIQESFTERLRSVKNKNKRKIRRMIQDGFTQMKSFLPQNILG